MVSIQDQLVLRLAYRVGTFYIPFAIMIYVYLQILSLRSHFSSDFCVCII